MSATPSTTPDISTPARNAAKLLCSAGAPQALVEGYTELIAAQYHPLLEQARDAIAAIVSTYNPEPRGTFGPEQPLWDEMDKTLAALTRALDEGKVEQKS